jgi:sugar phosphate isomerase/epimerase
LDTDRISFQLYSARKFPPLDGQLATLARLGYRNVEPYGGLFEKPEELRAALTKYGLAAPTAHIGIERLRKDLDAAARVAKDFGIGEIVVPAVPQEEREQAAKGWQRLGEELEGYRERLAGHGLGLAWHNHSFEFAVLPDGSYPLDHMFEAAPGVNWEADVAWIEWAREDAAAWIDKYKDRVIALHIKDLAPKGENQKEDGQADVGHGVIDWPKLMPAIRSPQVRYLVIEHDNPSDFERFARRSFETVAGW